MKKSTMIIIIIFLVIFTFFLILESYELFFYKDSTLGNIYSHILNV